jgi:hypothetical protein
LLSASLQHEAQLARPERCAISGLLTAPMLEAREVQHA